MKLNQWLLAAVVGMPFVCASLAAENNDTNRNADIEALKQQVQELSRKVQALEQQHALDRQTNAVPAQPENVLFTRLQPAF